MKLNKIKIKKNFVMSHPSDDKMNACRAWYAANGKLDRDIVVNASGVLVDGYVGYLVLLENGVKEAEVKVVCNRCRDPITYVFAIHPGDPSATEYVWRIAEKTKGIKNLGVGNRVLVATKLGLRTARITRIEKLDVPPVPCGVKKVIKCFAD